MLYKYSGTVIVITHRIITERNYVDTKNITMEHKRERIF